MTCTQGVVYVLSKDGGLVIRVNIMGSVILFDFSFCRAGLPAGAGKFRTL